MSMAQKTTYFDGRAALRQFFNRLSQAHKYIHFDGGTAGYFRTWLWPKRDGVYKYMPFRSPSHLRMHQRLRETGSARCYYERNGHKIFFSVVSSPKYGHLQLANFESEIR